MYDSFYKLSKKPFQLNPDPEFFFNSAVHKRGLAYLRYGLAQCEGFIVVTGLPGTGKTMLVKELFKELKHENIVAGLMVTTHVNAEDTLRIISATFGLDHDGTKADLLKKLEEFFKSKGREGQRILLVVDEAQNLPKESLEELRMLSNFELDGRSLFQSFLLGQDEFRQTLQLDSMEQVRQRVTATYHLRPLDVKETKEYILHRLTTADWQNDPEFSDDVFTEVFACTHGIPRRINSLCDRLMLYGFLEEMHKFDSNALDVVIKEIEDDSPKDPPALVPDAARLIRGNSMPEPVAANGSLEERVRYLEGSVETLQATIQRERALLRKAILIQLDMDQAFDIPADNNQAEVH